MLVELLASMLELQSAEMKMNALTVIEDLTYHVDNSIALCYYGPKQDKSVLTILMRLLTHQSTNVRLTALLVRDDDVI